MKLANKVSDLISRKGINMLELVRIKKTVVTKNEKGEEVKKHFTNFYLAIEINGQVINVTNSTCSIW